MERWRKFWGPTGKTVGPGGTHGCRPTEKCTAGGDRQFRADRVVRPYGMLVYKVRRAGPGCPAAGPAAHTGAALRRSTPPVGAAGFGRTGSSAPTGCCYTKCVGQGPGALPLGAAAHTGAALRRSAPPVEAVGFRADRVVRPCGWTGGAENKKNTAATKKFRAERCFMLTKQARLWYNKTLY